jgi:hypothetical protein
MRAERLLGRVNGLYGRETSEKEAKSKAPHVKPACGPLILVLGFIVWATRPVSRYLIGPHFSFWWVAGRLSDFSLK